MSFLVCFEHEQFCKWENQEQICDCTLMNNKYPSMSKSDFDFENFERVDA